LSIALVPGIAHNFFVELCENKSVENSTCHGQCHLHQQLEETSDESTVPSNGIKLTFDRDYTSTDFTLNSTGFMALHEPSSIFISLYQSCSLEVATAPPEC
jgi:hypothetical protein